MSNETISKTQNSEVVERADRDPSRSATETEQNSQEVSRCPPPQGWKSVVKNLREQSEPFDVLRDGHTLAGRKIGHGSPLYFLNGIGGTHELFSLTAWLLRDEFECVLFDYPSFRQDDGKKYRFALDDLVLDIEAMRNRLGHSRVDLFASSFGGLVALKWMLDFPESVSKAVIQAGFAHRKLTLFEKLLVRTGMSLPGTVHRLPFRDKIQHLNHRRWFPPFDHSRWQFFLDDTGKILVKDEARRANLIGKNSIVDRLHEIDTPVLLLHSEGDGIVSDRCQQVLKHGLISASIERLDNSGHIPYLTHPHRVAKIARKFL